MAKQDYSKIKTTTLVSVIMHGANDLGFQLSKLLVEQGSKVIVIDDFTKDNKELVTKLKKLGNVDFIALTGVDDLFDNLKRFDYLFYLQGKYLDSYSDFQSRDFLKESDRLDKSLKTALRHNAKVSLVTSINYNKELNERLLVDPDSINSSIGTISPYSPLEIQKYSETLAAEFHDKSNLNIRILRLGILLGEGIEGIPKDELRDLFRSSVVSNSITIQGEGLTNHYLVNIKDAVYGLVKLTFTKETNGEVVSVCDPKPLTSLSIAYKILELNPTATNIRFDKTEDSVALLRGQYTPAPNATKYSWKQSHSIQDTFIQTLEDLYNREDLSWSEKPGKAPQPEKTVAKTSMVKTPFGKFLDILTSPFTWLGIKTGKSSRMFKSLFTLKNLLIFVPLVAGLVLFSYYLLTPIMAISWNSFMIYRTSEELYTDLASFDFENSVSEIEKIEKRYKKVDTGIDRLEWVFTMTNQEDVYINVKKLSSAGSYAIDGAEDMITALIPLARYVNNFEPAVSVGSNAVSTTKTYTQELSDLKVNQGLVDQATYKIAYSSSIIDSVDAKVFPQRLQEYILEIKQINEEVDDLIIPLEKTISFIPDLLGVEERQRYLILLQNPSELRSTGGWLSSYAIIGIEGGQIRQLDVDDVYNLDGFLTTQGKRYEASSDMQQALGITYMNLSLSNWNPDFPSSADNAAFFIKEADKAHKIDGVIALDVAVIQDLIDIWEGIEVAGEDEIITSTNIYDKIYEIHEDFTPGSRRKTTFIANLSDAVIKMMLSDKASYGEIGKVLFENLNEKHVLISLKNNKASEFLLSEGWTGTLENSYEGLPFSVDWNWGANKANNFIERTISTEVMIENTESASITYSVGIKNTSKEDKYPEGNYENWMRVYIPESAQVTSVTGFKDNQFTTYLSNGKKVLAGWFNTGIQDTNNLTVAYRIEDGSNGFILSHSGGYLELDTDLYKQPGTDNDTYKLEVTYPDSWDLVDNNDMAKSINTLSSQFYLLEEEHVYISWEEPI